MVVVMNERATEAHIVAVIQRLIELGMDVHRSSGVTRTVHMSAALWTRVLRSLGAEVDVFVPHRGRDGYDMRTSFIERAKE